MKNNSIGKIAMAQAGHPRSRFNLAHDVNTTASLGDLQPLQCQLMVPNSKATLDVESLVRAAPMPAPTFGRINYRMWSMFVPLDEIFPNFDAMMARQKVGRSGQNGPFEFMPLQVPTITPKRLAVALLLPGATYSGWVSDRLWPSPDDAKQWPTELSQINQWMQYTNNGHDSTLYTNLKGHFGNYFNGYLSMNLTDFDYIGDGFNAGRLWSDYFGGELSVNLYLPCAPFLKNLTGTTTTEEVEPANIDLDAADFVFIENMRDGLDDHRRAPALAVRLSSYGSRMYKLLRGLGYPVDFEDDETQLPLLPLLAWYRGYFELFGLSLFENFEQSACSKLIQYITNNNVSSFAGDESRMFFDTSSLLWDFFRELGNCYVTEDVDYVSQHLALAGTNADGQSGVGLSSDITKFVNGGKFIDTSYSPELFKMAVGSQVTSAGLVYNGVEHGALDEQIMKIFFRWTNRQTIDGADLEKNLRSLGLGQYVDEIKVDFIGYYNKSLSISDISATSDTYQDVNGQESGRFLGEYAGKSVTYDKSKNIQYETKKFGYWITYGAIVPESGYCQGYDPTIRAVKPFDFYTPELDSRGYEATTKGELFGTGHIMSRREDIGSHNEMFGVRPRYLNFKVARNIANGDFELHSRRSRYLPFMLDKLLPLNERRFRVTETKSYNRRALWSRYLDFDNTPIAGNVWRYAFRYGFLGNLNRIFVNAGKDLPPVFWWQEFDIDNTKWVYLDETRDNFIVHNIFNLQYYAPMLPRGASYATADDEAGANAAVSKA